MSYLNKIFIIGNLGSDPESRFTPNGSQTCSFRVATNRFYTTPEGEKKEETEWFSIVTWNKLAENCNQFLTKGQRVYVEGRIHTRKWTDKENQVHYLQEIIASRVIFLDRRGNGVKPEDANTEDTDIDPKDIPF